MVKLFKSWAWECNEEKNEITILIQNTEGEWGAIATLKDCPRNGMTAEEFDEKYNDQMTEVIDELGWESVWCHTEMLTIVKDVLAGIWHEEGDTNQQFWEDENEEDIFLDRHNFRYKVINEDSFGDRLFIEKEEK